MTMIRKLNITAIYILSMMTLVLNVECTKPLVEQEDKVTKMCKRTSNFNLCMTILFPDHRSQEADAKGLAKMVMEKDMSVSKIILSSLQKARDDDSKALSYRAKCAKCASLYGTIVTDLLPRANQSVDSTKFSDAIQRLGEVGSNAKICDDQFTKGGDTSPIVNLSVHDISEIAIDILKTI